MFKNLNSRKSTPNVMRNSYFHSWLKILMCKFCYQKLTLKNGSLATERRILYIVRSPARGPLVVSISSGPDVLVTDVLGPQFVQNGSVWRWPSFWTKHEQTKHQTLKWMNYDEFGDLVWLIASLPFHPFSHSRCPYLKLAGIDRLLSQNQASDSKSGYTNRS